MKVVVIDGQGGKIGKALIEGLKALSVEAEIFALGTNGISTSTMIKAGANHAATGENAIIVNCRNADIIAGPSGIVIADSLLGEITPNMAVSIGQSSAQKVLLPLNRCGVHIVGVMEKSTTTIIDEAVALIAQLLSSIDKKCKNC